MKMILMFYTMSHKKEPTYFWLPLCQKSIFYAVFTVTFKNEQMWQYEFHPSHQTGVTTLRCQSQNTKNILLQQDITKYNKLCRCRGTVQCATNTKYRTWKRLQ